MANLDNPRGLWPVRHLTGGEIRTHRYILTASATIFRGDLVTATNDGDVAASAVDDGPIVIGVSAEYKVAPASGTTYVEVWDDPNIVFGIQTDSDATGILQADIFATANHVETHAGDATTGLSGNELDASDKGTGSQFRILGKIETPGNDWGPNVDVEVILAEHLYKVTTTL